MANFGKRPINDAGQAESLRRPKSFFHDGEERLDRQPYGTKARFVDPVGNVITLQISTPGDPKAIETGMRIRNEKHADGWVEHAKCPLRHGIANLTPALEREFRKLPAELEGQCAGDPKVMSRVNGELHAHESCPHVEWLIDSRRKAEAAANKKRNENRIREEERKEEAARLQAAQLEMVKEQLEERKAAKRAKKAPTE